MDLWSADFSREVNLVRHSATSPSISAATSSSYPPPPSAYGYPQVPMGSVQVPLGSGLDNGYSHQSNMHNNNAYPQGNLSGYPHGSYSQHAPSGYQPHLPPPLASQPQQGFYQPASAPITPTAAGGYYMPVHPSQGPLLSPQHMPTIDPRSNPSGMFTRNLIGSLCVSAFKLTDPDNNMGVWFILQDLSVRTEGSFR